MHSNGQWDDVLCVDSIVTTPAPCLCALDNTSAKFPQDLAALESRANESIHAQQMWAARGFAVAVLISLLPLLWRLGRVAGRRLLRTPQQALPQGSTSERQSGRAWSLGTMRSVSTTNLFSASSVESHLRAARASAGLRRLRVSFVMGQVGLALVVIGLTPTLINVSQATQAAIGASVWYIQMTAPGGFLMLLALFPTDARPIKCSCAVFAGLFLVLGVQVAVTTLTGRTPLLFGIAATTLCFAAVGAIAPTLRTRMQPRPALRRLWVVVRLFYVGLGAFWGGYTISVLAAFPSYAASTWIPAHIALSVALLLCASFATPRNRGRLHRCLGRLGASGTEEEEAAAVAALIGGAEPSATLQRATDLFCCLPACQLLASDLADNKQNGLNEGPTLQERTQPATMGDVTAFVSHSWSDEKYAPGAKHEVLSRWAARRRQNGTGEEPTLWLVSCTL